MEHRGPRPLHLPSSERAVGSGACWKERLTQSHIIVLNLHILSLNNSSLTEYRLLPTISLLAVSRLCSVRRTAAFTRGISGRVPKPLSSSFNEHRCRKAGQYSRA